MGWGGGGDCTTALTHKNCLPVDCQSIDCPLSRCSCPPVSAGWGARGWAVLGTSAAAGQPLNLGPGPSHLCSASCYQHPRIDRLMMQ